MMTDFLKETMREHMKELKLKAISQIFEEEAEKAAKSNLSYTEYLARLLSAEVIRKVDSSINTKVNKAHFPVNVLWKVSTLVSSPSLMPEKSTNWLT